MDCDLAQYSLDWKADLTNPPRLLNEKRDDTVSPFLSNLLARVPVDGAVLQHTQFFWGGLSEI